MGVANVILYSLLFISLFFEVYLLITYFEIRQQIKFERENDGRNVKDFPTATIIVPCYNEERTVRKTILSLLALDYPADKLALIIVDDGSSDDTQSVLDEFRSHPQIKILSKENGGKHTALNLALEHVTSDVVGCLDADSFVDSQALKKIVPYFADAEIMAVTPGIKIFEPKTVWQHVQDIEYSWSILLRRILASMGALYVTPGPFSIFRTQVFRELGGYRPAHHTEDLEYAIRMQKHHYKIVNSFGAAVYTVAPAKIKHLYRQRVRWTYGFLNNALDYRDMYFSPKYGNLGMFILPMGTLSIFSALFVAGHTIWGFLARIPDLITRYQAVGFGPFHWPQLSFDWFFLNTGAIAVITLFALFLSLVLLFLSLQMADSDGKFRFRKAILYYLTIYTFIVPFWLAKAAYATLRRQTVSWR